jgi:hypothetical protein
MTQQRKDNDTSKSAKNPAGRPVRALPGKSQPGKSQTGRTQHAKAQAGRTQSSRQIQMTDIFMDREIPMHQDSFPDRDPAPTQRTPTEGDLRGSNISSINRSEHMRAIQRKRAITSAVFLGTVVILIMVVAAAAILYVTDYVTAKPNYSFISLGTIEHSVGSTALIIRDEQTFTSSSKGSLVALATEGSRVAKNQELAMIIPDGMEETSAALRSILIQIVDLQRELMAEGKGSGADAVCLEADAEILPIIHMIRADSMDSQSINLVSYSSSIQVLMDRRDAALQNIDFQDEPLSTLIAKKNELQNSLSSQSVSLYAEIPGIVSYKLDGMENIMNTDLALAMLPEQCSDYIISSKASIPGDLEIESGEQAVRICQNAQQYLATIVSGTSVSDFPLDALFSIRVPSEGIVVEDCRVIRTVQTQAGAFVVFLTTSQVERLLDRRTAEIEIIMSETQPGLRVPVSSLINPDFDTGYAQILYNSSGYARKLTVTVLDHDREYAIIAPVEGFDIPNMSTIIITNPNTISEGDKVEQ